MTVSFSVRHTVPGAAGRGWGWVTEGPLQRGVTGDPVDEVGVVGTEGVFGDPSEGVP